MTDELDFLIDAEHSRDRATYDPSLTTPVSYTVAAAGDAPSTLTYGPSYMDVAGTLGGPVTFGVNRRLNNQANSIAAAKQAVAKIGTLEAFELGNEPDREYCCRRDSIAVVMLLSCAEVFLNTCFYAAVYSSSDPIANGASWTPAADVASQISWQNAVSSALGKSSIVQAGVFLQPPTWSVSNLAPKEGSALSTVKSFSDHSYPQSACGGASTDLASLMSHSGIVSYTSRFKVEAAAAHNVNKRFYLGETNSATCGGGGISPTFGAGLWIVDYVMQAVLNGVERLYFHQGTIGNCQYCWWGKYTTGAPYYGAYFAADALAGATQIAMLDAGTSNYAAYGIYKGSTLTKILAYNSDYYTTGTRSSNTFTFTNIGSASSVTASRLTAAAATSRVDQGQTPTISGLQFASATCAKTGTQNLEKIAVTGGSISVTVKASEAVLIYL